MVATGEVQRRGRAAELPGQCRLPDRCALLKLVLVRLQERAQAPEALQGLLEVVARFAGQTHRGWHGGTWRSRIVKP
jgi:hypothetical protein